MLLYSTLLWSIYILTPAHLTWAQKVLREAAIMEPSPRRRMAASRVPPGQNSIKKYPIAGPATPKKPTNTHSHDSGAAEGTTTGTTT